MGMDASVAFWYGIKIDYYDDEATYEEIVRRSEEASQSPPYEWKEDGFCIELIYPCDGSVAIGLGNVIAHYDWNDTPLWEEVYNEILNRPLDAAFAVDRVLNELGWTGERGVYMQTRYW